MCWNPGQACTWKQKWRSKAASPRKNPRKRMLYLHFPVTYGFKLVTRVMRVTNFA
jgi:hypothetical protein